jgi:hypothetical protein
MNCIIIEVPLLKKKLSNEFFKRAKVLNKKSKKKFLPVIYLKTKLNWLRIRRKCDF